MKKYDVVVVGSGPSGATTARWCAKYGFSTLLIDKSKIPRNKPCGGVVSSRALKQLDFKVNELIQQVYYNAKIYRPKGDFLGLESNSLLAIGVLRTDFDSFLNLKAVLEGASFEEERKLERIKFSPSGVKIHCNNGVDVTAEILVAADGVNSTVARQVGIRSKWSPNEIGLACVWESKIEKNVKMDLSNNTLEFYLGVTPAGYGWIFPKGDYINVGAGSLLKELKCSRNLMLNFIENVKKLRVLRITDPKYHLIPVGGFNRKISQSRILFVGDAAGFVDPLLGEGINYAIASGKIAAQSIRKAFQEGIPEKSSNFYEKTCKKVIETDLKYAYSLATKVYYNPDLTLGLLISDTNFSKSIINVLEGKENYRDLVKKLWKRIPISLGNIFVNKFRKTKNVVRG